MNIVKILRHLLSLVLCIVAVVICLNAAQSFQADAAKASYTYGQPLSLGDYSYSLTDYSYYGGDAYTGIQHAGADTSNNVVVLGIAVTDAANLVYGAQKDTANNVAALAVPVNSAASNVAAIGSLLSTALAFAFSLPGVKSFFDLILTVLEIRSTSAAKASQNEEPAAAEGETVPNESAQEAAEA